MTEALRACSKVIKRELDFFNAIMDRAHRKPFQKARSWQKVDGGIDVLAARCWSARIIWTKAIIQSLYSKFGVTDNHPKPNTPIRHLTLDIDEFCIEGKAFADRQIARHAEMDTKTLASLWVFRIGLFSQRLPYPRYRLAPFLLARSMLV